MTLASGIEVDPVDAGNATTIGGKVPAWLHVVVAWSVTLVALIFLGVLAILGKPEPLPLLIVASVAGGGALGLSTPLPLQ